ncbi:MAG TPA: hypothetical protein VF576_02185 [Rubricoccaceae bacterium]
MPAPELADVPPALADRARWVVWRAEQRDGQPKPTKVPYSAAHPARRASSTDPRTWTTFEAAVAACAADPTLAGLGFVFAEGDGLWGLDLDGCCREPFGPLHPSAEWLVDWLGGYAEHSVSGTGVHVVCRGRHPAGHANRATHPVTWPDGAVSVVGVEGYDRARYFTFSGRAVSWGADSLAHGGVPPRQAEIDGLCRTLLPPRPAVRPVRRLAPVPASVLERAARESDEALLRRAFAAKNGAAVEALYRGADTGHASASEADLALASHLLYWTDGDEARADRLFRGSARMRPKWDDRRGADTYGSRTLLAASGHVASAGERA